MDGNDAEDNLSQALEYKGAKYHLPEFRVGPHASGKKGGIQPIAFLSS
jgi:hypothetical protein